MNRPTPTDIIAARIPSAENTQRMLAEVIVEALRVAGYAIEDSTEYILANLGPGMTTQEIREWLASKRRDHQTLPPPAPGTHESDLIDAGRIQEGSPIHTKQQFAEWWNARRWSLLNRKPPPPPPNTPRPLKRRQP